MNSVGLLRSWIANAVQEGVRGMGALNHKGWGEGVLELVGARSVKRRRVFEDKVTSLEGNIKGVGCPPCGISSMGKSLAPTYVLVRGAHGGRNGDAEAALLVELTLLQGKHKIWGHCSLTAKEELEG